jgi:flagellar hook-associated protein 2
MLFEQVARQVVSEGGSDGLIRVALIAALRDVTAFTAGGILGATDVANGTLTTAIQGRNSEMRALNDQIDDWTNRLAVRQQTLNSQFTAMEVALQQSQTQGQYLSGQLTGLTVH